MPELPEVELVVRSLASLVTGRTIEAARLFRQRLAPRLTPDEFADALGGRMITRITRRGKHILMLLNDEAVLLTHLRMSGRFMLLAADRDDPKFTHASLFFTDGTRLIFQDQRHFGMMDLIATEDMLTTKALRGLAPEPFSNEFSAAYLHGVLSASKRPVKEVLLDQTKVCGLGNIYAAEALFLAGISPKRIAQQISRPRAARLRDAIIEVLGESIGHGSTMNVDPENIDGSYYGGAFESKWLVYDREGGPCSKCETAIARIKQGGRSTYYCRKCQK